MTTSECKMKTAEYSIFDSAAKIFISNKNLNYIYKIDIKYDDGKKGTSYGRKPFEISEYFNKCYVNSVDIYKFNYAEFKIKIEKFIKFYDRCSNIQKDYIRNTKKVDNLLKYYYENKQ